MPSAMEEGQRSELGDLLPLVGGGRGGRSLWSRPLLAVLLLYSFSSQFLPIEPYLVPYLTSVKGFSNFQVTVDIYPCSVYAQLVFTLLMAPACFYLSHKLVISLGVLGMLATYIIIWVGNSLLSMQIMQVTYGFGMSARLVFSSYIFHLVAEEEYQSMDNF
uniref:Folate transporter 1 n=1 Tax=Anthurium amnicola TaxID=1678845 RepID=A0A1D1YHY5_9ARAE